MQRRQAVRLFLCGAAALFWELALIRWQGSCVRIVAYFSNSILLAAFFGLGVGALLGRFHRLRLERVVFPIAGLCVVLAVALGHTFQANPGDANEYIWIGTPKGVATGGFLESGSVSVPYGALLALIYLTDAAMFAVFGYWLARLFRGLPPLRAYSIEIGGSIAGIVLFAALSYFGLSPVSWFVVGFCLLAITQERELVADLAAAASSVVVLGIVIPFASQFIWSPYYKIEFRPLQTMPAPEEVPRVAYERPLGYTLTVNNDYHQMLLDLHGGLRDDGFNRAWRALYDAPYRDTSRLPPGPVLVVGAGTGNDVSAALRRTDRAVDAVDIDATILGLGERFHPERPYQSPRVSVVVDDARSFLERTSKRYAIIVFGFLDSHTLLSSFSSLRLDNFVYTREALAAARERLLPGGEIYLTFAVNTPWIHDRLLKLVDDVFGPPTQVGFAKAPAYGMIFMNRRTPDGRLALSLSEDARRPEALPGVRRDRPRPRPRLPPALAAGRKANPPSLFLHGRGVLPS
jgi:SAM-dependent methyltransferase